MGGGESAIMLHHPCAESWDPNRVSTLLRNRDSSQTSTSYTTAAKTKIATSSYQGELHNADGEV